MIVSFDVFAAGTIVGTYRVIRKLGEGGMGAVFAAEHTLLGRKAAIKVLLPALSAREEIVHRFFNEARAVTQVADPGIVQVFDFGYHTDGSAFIVMELLEGEP
jgi:serine/threonine-protein kinase